jgi:hypothetical protein
MATGYLRWAIETTPNSEGESSGVSATTFDIPYMEAWVDPKPTLMNVDDEVTGYPASAPSPLVAEYAPEGSIKCKARPPYLGAMLQTCIGAVTTTAGNGVITDPDGQTIPTGAYRHVFNWATGAVPKTAQLNFSAPGTGALHFKAQGVAVEDMGFTFEDGVFLLNLALKGLVCLNISDPSITPSLPTVKPFVSGQMHLTWLAGSAVTEDFSFNLKNTLDIFKSFTTTSKYPDEVEFGQEPPVQSVVGSIPKRALDVDDWNALINCTTFAGTAHITHDEIIASGYRHQMWLEMPKCQYVEATPEPAKNTRQQKAAFNWEAKWDTGTSKFATVTLVNNTAAFFS